MFKALSVISLFLFQGRIASAQCNVTGSGLAANVSATAASCPLNGSIAISVTASAAGAPYTFILSGACLNFPITQSQAAASYSFMSLQGGCTYNVCISDAGGNIIANTATVANNYTPFSAVVITDSMSTTVSCSKLSAAATGGRPPYSYELFAGNGASGSPIQGPQSANSFTGISPATQYTVRVTDACNQSIVGVHATGNLIPISVSAGSLSAFLESCTSLREQIVLNDRYSGTDFSTNSVSAATLAGLQFPIVINAKDHTGQNIPGYPYTLNAGVPAPWGESPNITLFPGDRWSPPLPNNAALFPVTFSYTSGCGSGASAICDYNPEFLSAAYPRTPGSYPDTTQCPFRSCFRFDIGGEYIPGNFYQINVYTNAAATGTPVGTVTYPSQTDICGLARGTNFYFKVHDPCLNRDTILNYATDPAPPAFTITPTNCNTYCSGKVQAQFSYTGAAPNTVVIDSGPANYGPYPQTRTLANSLAVNSTLFVSDLPAGAYHFTFHTKCGETAVSQAVFEDGDLFASPIHSVMNTGCGSALVTITPHLSATGKVLDYHNGLPGCHTPAGTAYYANITFTQISNGAPVPGSGNIQVDNPNDGYTVPITSPGVYAAKINYAEGLPGLGDAVSYCYQIVYDTFSVALPPIPTITGFYTLPCAGSMYSIVPVAPNAAAGTLYTLYAANGTTVIAGPQTSNVFNNISTTLGNGLTVKAVDPCGQSSVAPVSQNSATAISGFVHCFTYMSGGVTVAADSLKADFINGATYLWTAPDGSSFSGANPPPVSPAQAGTWTLSATVLAGTCSNTLSNSFTTVICTQSVVPIGPPGADPRTDTIHLVGNVSLCKPTLTWTTTTEINSLNFYIESSDNDVTWLRIGTVAAAGNSSVPRSYIFIVDPSAQHKFYRIQQADADGRIKYSNIVEISTDCAGGTDILTGTNPVADGVFTFYFPSSTALGNASLIFVDAIGREYFSRQITVNAGLNIYSFRPQQILARGTFFIRLVSRDGRFISNTIKVVYVK